MKQLTCELCGSTEFMKENGVFICQSCGTKYSAEEAKKMIIDGTVDVTGTVSVESSASYERILGLARDAFNDRRFDSAYDYYCQAVEIRQDVVENVLRQGLSILAKEKILSDVPSSCINRLIRAIELLKKMPDSKEKSKIIISSIDDLKAACDCAKNFLHEEIDELNSQRMTARSASDVLADWGRPTFIASQNQAEDKKIERHNKAIKEKVVALSHRISKIADFEQEYKGKLIDCASINTQFKYYYIHDINKAVGLYSKISLSADEQKELILQEDKLHFAVSRNNLEQVKMLIQMGADVNKKDENSGVSPLFWVAAYKHENLNSAIQITKLLLENGAKINGDERKGQRTLLNTDSDEAIKELIIQKSPEMRNKISEAPKVKSSSGGCYVATAVYGSYDCPQVWTLRRYRDYTLAKTWYGRAFIRTYYAISPTLVKWFGKTNWFKKMWKPKLDRMVKNLRAEGVESTPYEDRNW